MFVGRKICVFRAREVNHLRTESKKGYCADGGGWSDYQMSSFQYPLDFITMSAPSTRVDFGWLTTKGSGGRSRHCYEIKYPKNPSEPRISILTAFQNTCESACPRVRRVPPQKVLFLGTKGTYERSDDANGLIEQGIFGYPAIPLMLGSRISRCHFEVQAEEFHPEASGSFLKCELVMNGSDRY